MTGRARSDPRLRFRVWVDGQLADEAWVDTSEPDAEQRASSIQASHAALAERAVHDGQVWLVEVYDPALPEQHAYLRLGADAGGMTNPLRLP